MTTPQRCYYCEFGWPLGNDATTTTTTGPTVTTGNDAAATTTTWPTAMTGNDDAAATTTGTMATMGMTATLGCRDHIQISQLNSLAHYHHDDWANCDNGERCRRRHDDWDKKRELNIHIKSNAAQARGGTAWATKMGDSTSTTQLQWGVLLVRQKWGTQCPQ